MTCTKVRSVRAAFSKGATWECDEATLQLKPIDGVFAPTRRMSRRERKREEQNAQVLEALTGDEQSKAALAKASGIARSTLDLRLEDLEAAGKAEEGERGWRLAEGCQVAKSLGGRHVGTPVRATADDDGLDDLGPEQPLPDPRCPKCDGGLGLEGECVFCSLETGEP
jgi:hypothetical protein